MTETFFDTGYVALALLRDPAVAANWSKPSALAEFRVSGLAGHLAAQVLRVEQVLTAQPGTEPPIRLVEHYRRSPWADGDVNSDVNRGIREHGESLADTGPAELADTAEATLNRLRGTVASQPEGRLVGLAWAAWSLTLDDFLMTRVMEMVVHGDDLAVSVGIDPPAMPPAATDATISLLAEVAAARHGAYAVIRALSRAERAPETIAAF